MRAHDHFFKAIFARSGNAADLLRSVLPPPLVGYLDLETLVCVQGSSVDGKLDERHKDLLFMVPVIGADAFVYILLEHKSHPARLTAFQCKRYAVDAWSDYLKAHKTATSLPWIIPVLVHHGASGWTRSLDIAGDLDELSRDVRDAMEPYKPSWQLLLYDVALESDADLRKRGMNAEATLALWCLARAPRSQQMAEELPRVHDLLETIRDGPRGDETLAMVAEYILQVCDTPHDKVHAYFRATLGPTADRAYMTAAEQLIARERDRIRKEERDRIRQEECDRIRREERSRIKEELLAKERRAVFAVLDARGLRIPDIVRARVYGCSDSEQLAMWHRQAVTVREAIDLLDERDRASVKLV